MDAAPPSLGIHILLKPFCSLWHFAFLPLCLIDAFPECVSEVGGIRRMHLRPPRVKMYETPPPPLPPPPSVPPGARSVSALKSGIATFYDESSGLWEDMWGEHMHHGYYPEGGAVPNHRQAQVGASFERGEGGGRGGT